MNENSRLVQIYTKWQFKLNIFLKRMLILSLYPHENLVYI